MRGDTAQSHNSLAESGQLPEYEEKATAIDQEGRSGLETSAGTKTCWHCLVGATLKALLEPVGIEVRTEVPLLSFPPKADIILLQRRKGGRTDEQNMLMADGLRDLDVERILAEIKITQSMNEAALNQASLYDVLYRKCENLKKHQLRTVIVSAATAQKPFLKRFAFKSVGPDGVYESKPLWGEPIRVIFLNELENIPRNAPLKFFSSRTEERKKAFAVVDEAGLTRISTPFHYIMNGLRSTVMRNSLRHLDNAGITPDSVMRMGKRMFEATLDLMPEEELSALPKLEHLLGRKLQDGQLKGEQIGEAKMLIRQLQRRFGAVPAWAGEKIAKATSQSLEEWSLRVLDAQSLEDVFADRM
ncbi:MAG: DUF4351 domain-containing protein [Magnetococcales bacterium]|nr:DUF4351 domain-containing protein [Magnetococcales bacterium]